MTEETRHRVMIELKEEPENGAQVYFFDGFGAVGVGPDPMQRSTITTEAEVYDNRTLQLSKVNSMEANGRVRGIRQIQFDCVGGPNDTQTRAEFASMLDALLLKHYNCCLIQFTLYRECQVQFLSNLLVSEIDQRTQKWHLCLHGIRLEFHDMRKFEVVNMFSKNINTLRQRPRNHFNNTLELLKWLHTDYTHLWASARGHSILDVHLHYTDSRRRMHRTKFCIVHIHMINMDIDMKTSLKNFFESYTGHKRLKHTNTVIDCLREYFSGPEIWRTWMLFHVPTSNSLGTTTEDLLNLAKAAYSGSIARHALSKPLALKESAADEDCDVPAADAMKALMKIPSLRSNAELKKPQHESVEVVAEPELKGKLSNIASGGKNTPDLTVATTEPKPKNKRVGDFSTKDLDSLSNWYAKVDEKFTKVIAAMEGYCERKYQTKIGKIGEHIQQIVRTDNAAGDDVTDKASCPWVPRSIRESDVLKELYNKYCDALTAFRQMEKQVLTSQFSEQLLVYLKTKNYELTQHALQYKMHQLESCRGQLTEVIKQEMNALKTLKTKTASMQSMKPRNSAELKTPEQHETVDV